MSRPPVDFVPAPDPLLRDPRLDYVVELPVIGLPVRFETNSRYVSNLVEESFGAWRGAPPAPGPGGQALRFRLVVYAGNEAPPTDQATGSDPSARPSTIRHICPDPYRVLVHSPGGMAVVDPERRDAVGYVSTALAGEREFRRGFLEAVALALVTHFDRHPVHAAAIGRERAVLLAGPSGVGKSTLAWLAHNEGLGVLSEEIVWVEQEPRFRLWGLPGRVHLRPEALNHFPELATPGAIAETMPDGKLAVGIVAKDAAPRFTADAAVVCVLERGAGPVRLERLAPEAVAAALRLEPAAGFDRLPERREPAIAALTRRGGWRLVLSGDPRGAVGALREMVEG